MKKKILMVLSLCLLLGALACGCGQNNTGGTSGSANAPAVPSALVGTWTQVTDDGSPSLPDVGIPSGYVFNSNGTGEDLFWNMKFSYTVTDDKIHISYEDSIGEDSDYRYSIEGDTLSMKRTDDPEAIAMLYKQKVEEESKEEAKEKTKKDSKEKSKKDSKKKEKSK